MKPNLKNRHIVTARAPLTWDQMLKHRIYSCPQTPIFDALADATCLMLIKDNLGPRVHLGVSCVISSSEENLAELNALPHSLRERLERYRTDVAGIAGILHPHMAHRFFFLDDEPWPEWLQELTRPASTSLTEWAAILSICSDPDAFFQWPLTGKLLWPGCIRAEEDGAYDYPGDLPHRLARVRLRPDPRTNGPAILAFRSTGGNRPTCENEGWPIHHIYDGTGAVAGVPPNILHAVRDGQHFTHSAGLVAAQPVIHHLAHQSNLLKWLLRREAFVRFGYDPMNVFSERA